MVKQWNLFEVERQDDTMILKPLRNLGEFVMLELQEETDLILESCKQDQVSKLLIDLCETDYLESTALGFLVALHKRVTENQGRMACCRPSRHELQILEITNLNEIIPIFDTREDALEALVEPN